MDEQNVAVYLDFENLVISAEETYPSREKPLNVGPMVDYANSKGNIIMKKAYADWSMREFSAYQGTLIKNGFDLVHLPATSAQGKNGSDVKLAIDVMEHLELLNYISTIIIGSGDTDFVPLIQFVKSRGKRVIVMGFDHSVGDLVKRNSTEYKSLIELYGLPEIGTLGRDSQKDEGDKGRSLLIRFIRIRNSDDPIYLGNLKEQLMRLDPSFSERRYGFSSFLEYAEQFKGDLVDSIEWTEDGHPMVRMVDLGDLPPEERSTFEEAKAHLGKTIKFIKDGRRREKMASILYDEMKSGKPLSMKDMYDLLYSKKLRIPHISVKKYIFMLFTSGSFQKKSSEEHGPLMNRKMKLRRSIKGPEALDQNYLEHVKENLKRHFPDLGYGEISDLVNY
jgi:hypothetical protein